MPVYQVRDLAGQISLVEARTTEEAKRLVCKRRGIRPDDYWVGTRTMTARRIKEEGN
ncbi:MAG: hypothetical protein GX493_11335 [Firmicutes bacterium]|nr:hypothetical protein [Bacillota bacterium]